MQALYCAPLLRQPHGTENKKMWTDARETNRATLNSLDSGELSWRCWHQIRIQLRPLSLGETGIWISSGKRGNSFVFFFLKKKELKRGRWWKLMPTIRKAPGTPFPVFDSYLARVWHLRSYIDKYHYKENLCWRSQSGCDSALASLFPALL